LLIRLWNHLPSNRKAQFWLVFLLMIVASIAEVISIGAVLPFLGVLTSPETLFEYAFLQPLIEFLDISQPNQLLLPITGIFISAVFFAGVIRIILLYTIIRLSFMTGADLSINIYKRTLYQEYPVHVMRNSSEVINGIIVKTNAAIGVINFSLIMMSSFFIIIGIIGALFVIDASIAFIVFISFGLIYMAVVLYTRDQLKKNSKIIADQSTLMVKSLQEGLGGIRDVLIDGSQKFYSDLYKKADLPLRHASGNNQFINGSPRYLVETIGMVFIIGFAYSIIQHQEGSLAVIPILGSLALGAQKLLPALQQFYGAYSNIKGEESSLADVIELLDQPLPEYIDKPSPEPIKFDKEIRLEGLNFSYSKDTPVILNDVNLSISKGMRIGFIGTTGSGKSTLLDIIMGLLSPLNGDLLIDNQKINRENMRSWQMHIAHVPQFVYLSDASIKENIAFGVVMNEIDNQQVKEAAKQAQLSELIDSWELGYETPVGERGIRLSGGQRQRIGIARALYKKADVLIFDEATSSLDSETERLVMNEIDGLEKDLTILIIAHRLTTLKGCDKIVKVDNTKAIIGQYSDMIKISKIK
jgi:ATP-binding cassette, subfamily B, bacterial PglK